MTATHRDIPQIALDELHILAGIIERKEQVRLRQRNWIITAVSGLSIAFFSDSHHISPSEYTAVTLATVVIFWLMETVYQHVEDRAIQRSRSLEELLRDGRPYDGPLISESLSPRSLKDQLGYVARTFLAPRVASPYLALVAVVITFAIVG
ncbi:MAG TPA: hypothetical protein VG053_09420 [Solirubrobacteraceae bacterium]|jgi:hypothetical protein|nr:hypothetical protein [Solirubrobacteraceae bacterium]